MKKQKKFRRSSFTLIEVVIVIVILVTLASIATPMYLNYVKSANIGAAKSQIKLLVDAVNGYKLAYKNSGMRSPFLCEGRCSGWIRSSSNSIPA